MIKTERSFRRVFTPDFTAVPFGVNSRLTTPLRFSLQGYPLLKEGQFEELMRLAFSILLYLDTETGLHTRVKGRQGALMAQQVLAEAYNQTPHQAQCDQVGLPYTRQWNCHGKAEYSVIMNGLIQQLVPANGSRFGVVIQNVTAGANMYIGYNAADSTKFFKLVPGAFYTDFLYCLPIYVTGAAPDVCNAVEYQY